MGQTMSPHLLGYSACGRALTLVPARATAMMAVLMMEAYMLTDWVLDLYKCDVVVKLYKLEDGD